MSFSILWTLSFHACTSEPNTPFHTDAHVETQLRPLALLPDKIKESSGIIYKAQDIIWTHNDAGGKTKLYEVRTDEQKMIREVKIINAENKDWEDLADDKSHLYIGDFGNNKGKRDDLVIYKIKKADLLFGVTEVMAEKIEFTYPDQTVFDWPDNRHNFDAEALLSTEDHLYIFSKNIEDKQSKLYQLSKEAGSQTATLIETFDTNGWITGATISNDESIVCLIGYNKDQDGKKFAPFFWIFYDFTLPNFFYGKTKRVELAFDLHIESITVANNGLFLISTEKEDDQDGQIFELDVEKWID